MKTFHCDHCGHLVYFENERCQACGHLLGYLSGPREMGALEALADGLWRRASGLGGALRYRMCRNRAEHNICNWMLAEDDPAELCESCRLTEVIPALGMPGHRTAWYRMEQAKRRLLDALAGLGLRPRSRREDPKHGLGFRFLADTFPSGLVLTGHHEGIITLNLAEADDVLRERTRALMGEPYRTLLGHFRHEIGHFYWERLFELPAQRAAFRGLFGDERTDYRASLQQHYVWGPPPQWQQQFVSGYASAHPWEDWAETWAQYLHMVDTLETAQACGLVLAPTHAEDPCLGASNGAELTGGFDALLAHWLALSYVLNNLHRSLGLPDGCQVPLAATVIDKLRFVHERLQGPQAWSGPDRVVHAAAAEGGD